MSLEGHEDKKDVYDGGFTTAVEPGHQATYGEQPQPVSGLKRQLKSRHVRLPPSPVTMTMANNPVDGDDLHWWCYRNRSFPWNR